MIYLIYFVLVPISLVITLTGVILAPVLPLLAVKKEWWLDNHSYRGIGYVLPSWLNWFNTPDNDLEGDAGFVLHNGRSYLSKVKWLWRNPAYTFGIRYLQASYTTKVWGDKTIKDNDNAKEGWCFVTANGLFQFRFISRIGNTNRCFLANFGWNIMGLVDDGVNPKPNNWQSTFVFSPRISGFR